MGVCRTVQPAPIQPFSPPDCNSAPVFSPAFLVVDIAWITVVLSLRINRAIAPTGNPRSAAIRQIKARAWQTSTVPRVRPQMLENGRPISSQTAFASAMNSVRLSRTFCRVCRISAISSGDNWIISPPYLPTHTSAEPNLVPHQRRAIRGGLASLETKPRQTQATACRK